MLATLHPQLLQKPPVAQRCLRMTGGEAHVRIRNEQTQGLHSNCCDRGPVSAVCAALGAGVRGSLLARWGGRPILESFVGSFLGNLRVLSVLSRQSEALGSGVSSAPHWQCSLGSSISLGLISFHCK